MVIINGKRESRSVARASGLGVGSGMLKGILFTMRQHGGVFLVLQLGQIAIWSLLYYSLFGFDSLTICSRASALRIVSVQKMCDWIAYGSKALEVCHMREKPNRKKKGTKNAVVRIS